MLLYDIEADGFLDSLTRIWCIAIAEPTGPVTVYADQPGYPSLASAVDRLANADRTISHNGTFYDWWVINRFFPGKLRYDQQVDTLILSRMRDPESDHSLKNWGERLRFPKGEWNEWDRFSKEMATYCGRDVELLQKVWADLKPYYDAYPKAVECEHKVAYVLAKQEQHGFRLDVAGAQALDADLRQEALKIERKLQEVFPPRQVVDRVLIPKRDNQARGYKEGVPVTKYKTEVFNPGSRQQIASRLTEKYGWKPKDFTDSGQAKVDEEILSQLGYPEAKLLSEYLRIDKMLGQISDGKNGWLKLEKNGYVHGKINQCGARTHRMSHFTPNMAQVDKDPRMRSLWLPDPGDVLVGCDAEGIELRLLGHYLAKYDQGRFAKAVVEGSKADGTDAHSMNMKAGHLFTRDGAKTTIYALIYGAGDWKLGKIYFDDAKVVGKHIDNPKAALGKLLRGRLETGIVGLGELTRAAKRVHHERGFIKGLDGRPIKSDSSHNILNTIIQSAGALIMKYALVLFDQQWGDKVKYCANVHDEVQLSAAPDLAEEVGKAFAQCITDAGVLLGVRCPLAGAYQIGKNWKETH